MISVIGKVAYKFRLPNSTTIHVFHVSQLKAFYGEFPVTVTLPSFMQDSAITKVPQAILDMRVQKVHNSAQVKFLVQWVGLPSSEATWESAMFFTQQFPNFPIQ